ncbi:MAG TPA: hypothetical protein VEV17_20735 [Bryobacteraceae bacterium]|nr:hypothetical protein [Bryobacteraceae bacterium]
MPQFLFEVPHSQETMACARQVHVFLSSGSHFLSHADWGCMDGVHCAWLVVEAANQEEARVVVPPLFRSRAKIVGLNKFSLEQIQAVMEQHKP